MVRVFGKALGTMALCLLWACAQIADPMAPAFGRVRLGQALPPDIAVEAEEGDDGYWQVEPGWFHQTEIVRFGGRDFDALYRVLNGRVAEIYLRGFAEGNVAECDRHLQELAAPYAPFDGPATRAEVSDPELVRGVSLTAAGQADYGVTPYVPKLRAMLKRRWPDRVLEFMAFSMDGTCFELQVSYRLE
jgi:hypothetical protein